MTSLLKDFNYTSPIIVPGKYDNAEIEAADNIGYHYLKIDGQQFMAYNINSHFEAYQVFSHYYFARGHVIVTGMGFGARENWILTKPEVTKLTIIEKNESVLNYHKIIESPFLKDPRVEIVITDASKYKSKCDVLLLDHYEMESYENILENVGKIKFNIECDLLWFWPLETIIMRYKNSADYTCIGRSVNINLTNYQSYKWIKKTFCLNKLPDLDKELIGLFCIMHGDIPSINKTEKLLSYFFFDYL